MIQSTLDSQFMALLQNAFGLVIFFALLIAGEKIYKQWLR